MNKKKKILLSLTALLLSMVLIVSGSFAFFVVYDRTGDEAKTGSVFLDVSEITVGHNTIYKMNGSSVTSTPINASDSWANLKNNLTTMKVKTYTYPGTIYQSLADYKVPSYYWIHADDNSYMANHYFRSSTGKVVYCVDYGKNATDATYSTTGNSKETNPTTILKETTPVSDDVKKILEVGYPNLLYDAYENARSNAELEWATAVAIYIQEATAYDKNTGELKIDDIIVLEEMSSTDELGDAKFLATAHRFPEATEEATKASIETSERLRQLVKDILIAADKVPVAEIEHFYLDDTHALSQPVYSTNKELEGYKVGPFYLDNTISKATLSLLDKNNKPVNNNPDNGNKDYGVKFINNAGATITSLEYGYTDPFFVYVPADFKDRREADNLTSVINIVATIDNPENYEYPMYYYWSGNNKEPKMISCERVQPKASVRITEAMYDDYTYWNPGDVLTVKWTVENAGTKSVVTRNIVSIYWENNNMSSYANQKDIVYLYPEETISSQIYAEQFPATKAELESTNSTTATAAAKKNFRLDPTLYKTACMNTCSYKTGSLESMGTVFVNGKEYIAGYSFIVYGDALDGVGLGAEKGNAKEVNYKSQFDETIDTLDEVSFKLCLSSAANIHTMNQRLVIRVETQAMQYRNTSDAEWNTLFRDSYYHTDLDTSEWDSMWKTTAVNEYVIGTGSKTINDPLN